MNKVKMSWWAFSEQRSYLMGFAIAMLILFHCCEDYTLLIKGDLFSYVGPLIGVFIHGIVWIGACGVEIFLFLSGIGLYFSYSNKPLLYNFYKKRLVAILIPYLIIAIPYLIWQNFSYTNHGFLNFLKDLSLFTTFTKFNRQGWYVALILVMYLLFPAFFYIIKRYGYKGFALLEIIFLSLPFLVLFIDERVFNTYQVALTRIPTFILGVYCGEKVYQKKERKWFPLIILGIAVLLYVVRHAPVSYGKMQTIFSRYEKAALTISGLFLISLFLQSFKIVNTKKILNFLAPMTLELYLTSVEVRRLFSRLFVDCWTISNVTLACISVVFISIPVANFVHRLAMRLSNYLMQSSIKA